MSDDIRLNASKLDEFAHYLGDFGNELESNTKNLLGRLRDLGNTWNDPKYSEFADDLERDARAHTRQLKT